MGAIDVMHQKTHEGKVYAASKIYLSVGNNEYADVRIKCGSKDAHMEIFILTEGKTYAYSYSGTTYSENGTLVDKINRNTNYSDTGESLIYHTPTIDTLGIKRFEQMIGAGSNSGNQIAGSYGDRVETVHKANSDFLIRVQNKAGTAKDISIYAIWYEMEVSE